MKIEFLLVKSLLDRYKAKILVFNRIKENHRVGTRFSFIFDKIEQL